MRSRWILMGIDILTAAMLLLGIWYICYLHPQKGIPATAFPLITLEDGIQGDDSLQHTDYIPSQINWKKKFSDKFSDTVIQTATTYRSSNLSITISHHTFDSGKVDSSTQGKHLKYGTKITYTLADIYVGDITCLQAAFAKDTYGVGYQEKLTDLSKRNDAILSINGDSYNNNQHKDNGTIIRNGCIYRDAATNIETCVLNWDGTMKIYQPEELNTQTLIQTGAYQSWIFGPSLLDENRKAKIDFLTWCYILESHPRTAIGYYEPGHYCFVIVDGRQKDYSRGMFLEELSQLLEQLGCKVAYNLDGGHCSFMTYTETVVNHPYKSEHSVPDGILLTEGIQ